MFNILITFLVFQYKHSLLQKWNFLLSGLREIVHLVPPNKTQGGGTRAVDSHPYLTCPYSRQRFNGWKSQEKGWRTLLLMEALNPYTKGARWQSRAILGEEGHSTLIFKWHQRTLHCVLPQDSVHLSSPWWVITTMPHANSTQLLPSQTQIVASLLKKKRILAFSFIYSR